MRLLCDAVVFLAAPSISPIYRCHDDRDRLLVVAVAVLGEVS